MPRVTNDELFSRLGKRADTPTTIPDDLVGHYTSRYKTRKRADGAVLVMDEMDVVAIRVGDFIAVTRLRGWAFIDRITRQISGTGTHLVSRDRLTGDESYTDINGLAIGRDS